MRRLLKYLFVLILFVGLVSAAAWWFWPREALAGLQNDTAQAEITKMEDVLLVAGLVGRPSPSSSAPRRPASSSSCR